MGEQLVLFQFVMLQKKRMLVFAIPSVKMNLTELDQYAGGAAQKTQINVVFCVSLPT